MAKKGPGRRRRDAYSSAPPPPPSQQQPQRNARPAPPPPPPQPQQPQPQPQPAPPLPPPYQRHSWRSITGDLYFKTTANPEWAKVDPVASVRRRGLEVLTDVVFDGGIQVCQLASEHSAEYGSMWKIRWEAGQYDRVHVQEFTRPGMDNLRHIAVQFRPLTQPMGSLVPHGPTQEANARDPSAAPVASHLLQPAPDPARFPLGRLSSHFAQEGYTTCLLVFRRHELRNRGVQGWIWAASLTFLRGLNVWVSPPRKSDTDVLRRQRLDELASSQYLSTRPFTLRATNRGYWLTSRDDTSELLFVPDLPSEAMAVADTMTLRVTKTKRQLESLELENESMKRTKTEVEQLFPLRMAENERRMLDLKTALSQHTARRGQSQQGEEEQQQQQQPEPSGARWQDQPMNEQALLTGSAQSGGAIGQGDRLEQLDDQQLQLLQSSDQRQAILTEMLLTGGGENKEVEKDDDEKDDLDWYM